MALPDGSIMTDEPEVDLDSAAEALLKRWQTKQEPSKTVNEEVDDEAPRVNEEVDTEEQEEAEEPKPRRAAEDDDEVVVEVDGQQHKVAVKDLKRLFGQEASLTQKSQQLAEVQTQARTIAEKHAVALNSMLTRAQEQFKPYKDINWGEAAAQVAAGNLSKEEYDQLRAAHDHLKTNVDFFEQELGKHVEEARGAQAKQLEQAADACVTALTDPNSEKTYIEGFNENLYSEIRQYAMDSGVPQQLIDQTYDPVAIKLIHKAMLFDKAQKTGVKKLATAPKNVSKTPTNEGSASSGMSQRKAMEKLRQSGDPDDAMAALLARWGS